ncbi:MAG: DNA-processing protein DprA [Candidatus Omnitrophota bacterium]|nr:MAG: DNA-processing protein DprA [Candidatus Omnitrophota bacterium]
MTKAGFIFLNLLKGLSLKKIGHIMHSFGSSQCVLEAPRMDLQNVPSLTAKDIELILRSRDSDILEKELKLIEQQQISVIDIFDAAYPCLLKEISCPPPVLYIKGNRDLLSEILFAIVGSRIPTVYGISMAEEFSEKLASLGLVITSGLARGIDTAAHRAAIRKGRSVAVLGGGLLNVYPRENTHLAEEIAETGAVISEFGLSEPPLRENFPRRNRIISGLARGVLVVEAAARSGALITARYGCEQNREVFALPGNVSCPLSRGTHTLIKEGAKLVESVEDILEELNIHFQIQEKDKPYLDSQERLIFDIIDREGMYLEEIMIKSNLNHPLVSKTILELQCRGLIREIKPSCFVKVG